MVWNFQKFFPTLAESGPLIDHVPRKHATMLVICHQTWSQIHNSQLVLNFFDRFSLLSCFASEKKKNIQKKEMQEPNFCH